VKAVFVDTAYWIAVVKPDDPWRADAEKARKTVGPARLFTTDEILTEFLAAFSRGGPSLRMQAGKMVRAILADPNVTVLPQSRASFLDALTLYEKRLDKGYSSTDCRSMEAMRSQKLIDVLTTDDHFRQEGFNVLIGAQ
jgi:predicted nucleic acid-binding protein